MPRKGEVPKRKVLPDPKFTDAPPDVRRRMLELQVGLPPWWVAIVGGLCAMSEEAGDRMVGEARECGDPVGAL